MLDTPVSYCFQWGCAKLMIFSHFAAKLEDCGVHSHLHNPTATRISPLPTDAQ